MSQQPNSGIKLSWAAEGRESEDAGELLLLTLPPSPDLHSSPPFKDQSTAAPLALSHAHTRTAPACTHLGGTHVRLHFESSDPQLNYIWSVLARVCS